MSLTVEKCMSLPAFRHAKIVAGYGGITQSVESITVLEYAGDISLISSDLFLILLLLITILLLPISNNCFFIFSSIILPLDIRDT